jgi:hypothetical protein
MASSLKENHRRRLSDRDVFATPVATHSPHDRKNSVAISDSDAATRYCVYRYRISSDSLQQYFRLLAGLWWAPRRLFPDSSIFSVKVPQTLHLIKSDRRKHGAIW